jgi:magnesium-transporting ATPase (P-type)
MGIEIVFNILVGLGIVFYLANALRLPTTDKPADVLGAGGFPIILGILGLIVLAMITMRVLKEKSEIHIPMLELHSVDGRMLAINVILLAAYIGLIDVIGFILSTLIYLVACPLSIGYRKAGVLTIFSVVATTILVVVFGVFFFVPLPRGINFFREFSYMIY